MHTLKIFLSLPYLVVPLLLLSPLSRKASLDTAALSRLLVNLQWSKMRYEQQGVMLPAEKMQLITHSLRKHLLKERPQPTKQSGLATSYICVASLRGADFTGDTYRESLTTSIPLRSHETAKYSILANVFAVSR